MAGAQGIISSNALTLADYALNSNQPLMQRVTMSLIDYGNVLQDVPLVTKASLIANGTRFEGNLPTVNWTPLNSEGVTTKGVPTAYQEQVYLIRNYIDVDKFIVMDQNQIVEPRGSQTQAYLEALTYDFNTKFFKNDHATGDVNSFVGIRARIDNGGLFGVRSENKIDAGGLDISTTALTTAATQYNGNKMIELLDQLLWSVGSPDGAGVTIYMNDNMKRRLNFMLRALGTAGGLDVSKDMFDRDQTTYKNAVLRDPGVRVDQTTRIILGPAQAGVTGQNGETATGADGSTNTTPQYTSIYAVNYSTDHFFGWQMAELNTQDLGLVYDGAFYRTLIDWAVGFMNVNIRSLARIYDIKIC